MIYCGIKVGVQDWAEKISCEPDFVEISFDNTYSPQEYTELLTTLKGRGIPFFVHLSTSFFKDGDEILLNIASSQNDIREKSRKILKSEIMFFNDFRPLGYIIHIPTKRDFSRHKKLFGSPSKQIDYLDGLHWIQSQSEYIMLETSTASIRINNEIFETQPFDQNIAIDKEIPNVLDTGHFATLQAHRGNELTADSYSNFHKFNYYHVATLCEYLPYDNHGVIFKQNNSEYPNNDILEELITKRIKKSLNANDDLFFICEPRGGVSAHIQNFKHLKFLQAQVISDKLM